MPVESPPFCLALWSLPLAYVPNSMWKLCLWASRNFINSVCVCVFVCSPVSVHKEVRGQHQVSFYHSPPYVLRQGLSPTLGLTIWAILAGLEAPEIQLTLPPKHWYYKPTAWVLEIQSILHTLPINLCIWTSICDVRLPSAFIYCLCIYYCCMCLWCMNMGEHVSQWPWFSFYCRFWDSNSGLHDLHPLWLSHLTRTGDRNLSGMAGTSEHQFWECPHWRRWMTEECFVSWFFIVS